MLGKQTCVVVILVLGMAVSGWASSTISEAIDDAAGYLVTNQAGNGAWAGAEAYTGSIVAGLVNAYDIKGSPGYKTAAENGGAYIVNTAGGNYYGDEAYGLTKLSGISTDPASNSWRTEVSNFYQAVNNSNTADYIGALKAGFAEDSQALFYLAQHAQAADYVSAADKALWRQSVIDTLADLTDDDSTPVMALGSAVQALALTGSGLDSTVISASGSWAGVQLDDLPGILAGHQVASGSNQDSFYWLFDHTGGDGYTEDTVFGTLGLIAADTDAGWDYSSEILNARKVLTNGDNYGFASPDYGVQADGSVQWHIWDSSFEHYVFVGETLQALPEPGTLSLLTIGAAVLARRRRKRR